MNCRFLLLIISLIILSGCNQYNQNEKLISYKTDQKYKNVGFALILNDKFKNDKKISRKIDDRSLIIFHKTLKKNSFVKITNPMNNKSIIVEVISNAVKFSEFYNSVITNRIVDELSLDANDPYVELVLISKNTTFVAKKAITFDEEKKIAEKAPIDGIKIDNLGSTETKQKKTKNKSFLYSIKIADFYYKESAKNLISRIENETSLKNSIIKKISKTKYRVLIGPYNDIKKLEETFNVIKTLNFENLEILKNV